MPGQRAHVFKQLGRDRPVHNTVSRVVKYLSLGDQSCCGSTITTTVGKDNLNQSNNHNYLALQFAGSLRQPQGTDFWDGIQTKHDRALL